MKLRVKAENDFYFHMTEILGYEDFYEPYHRPLCEWFAAPHRFKYRLTLEPRGHFKTTCGSVGLPTWVWLKNPMMRFLRVHYKADQAVTDCLEIENHFVSTDKYRFIIEKDIGFDDPKTEAYRWLNDRFYINRPKFHKVPSYMAIGMGGAVTGFHFDWFLLDDLHTHENCDTPLQLEDVKKYIRSLRPMMREPARARVDVIGTRWNLDDAYGAMIDPAGPFQSPKKNCDVRIGSCFGSDGKPVFPTRFPKEELELAKQDMGVTLFSFQMLNNPLPEGTRMFDSTKTQIYDSDVPRDENGREIPLITFIAVDPNRREDEGSDPGVVSTFGRAEGNRFFELETYYARMGVEECVERIMDQEARWHPEFVIIESTAGQTYLTDWVLKRQAQVRHSFRIREVPRGPTVHKYKRILRIQPVNDGGRLYLRPQSPILKEIHEYPFGKADHGLDALSDIVHLGFDPRSTRPPSKTPHGRFILSQIIAEHERKKRRESGVGRLHMGAKW